ncbi:MAG TPA: histidine phosphatase family protein [Anaeromyxobacteraceae bacterium]|nr:histidine phosphatase family protein [Anaeromyxobacteraceae bacterium]
MSRPPELWLVRHGETPFSRTGHYTGRRDLPLSDEGERQARAVGARLAGRSFSAVLVSPLLRARQTCALAGYAAAAREDPDLVEWDYGAHEGRRHSDVLAERPGWTIWRDGAPGGERLADVAARAARVLARLEGSIGDAALFAHGHLLRVLAALWLGLPPEAARLLRLQTGSLSVLGHEEATRVVQLWNERIWADVDR